MNAAKKAEQEKEQMPDFMKKAEEYFSNNRKIFLWNQVDDESAGKIVKQLLYLDSLSHDDIIFFINSKRPFYVVGFKINKKILAVFFVLKQTVYSSRKK